MEISLENKFNFSKEIDEEIEKIFNKNYKDIEKILIELFLSHRLMYLYGHIHSDIVVDEFRQFFKHCIMNDDDIMDKIIDDIVSRGERNINVETYVNNIYVFDDTYISKGDIKYGELTVEEFNIIKTIFSSIKLSYDTIEYLKKIYKYLLDEILYEIYSAGEFNILSLFYSEYYLDIDSCIKIKPTYISSKNFRQFFKSESFKLYEFQSCIENGKEYLKLSHTCENFRMWIHLLYSYKNILPKFRIVQ